MSAAGNVFKSYTSSDTAVATVSGTTIKVNKPGAVTIYSNWYAATPWVTNGYGNYSGWSGSARRLQFSNGGANMAYYINNTGASLVWPAGSNPSEYPTGWLAGYTDYNHGNSGYVVFKACTSGTNKDGSNRCGQAGSSWIGSDSVKPTTEMGTAVYKGGNLDHYWATNTTGVSGARIKWVDTTTNYIGSGCRGPYDGNLTTQMAIELPTPGGSWVWNATYRVTAYNNGPDGNYSWISRSTIMTRDVESYAYSGCGNTCGIWQRMIPYSQSGVSAASHTNWC